ncbi:MAG TPA: signal peptidase II [Rhabdochlamydiaceae bacterium]|jgi:signal peptidase II
MKWTKAIFFFFFACGILLADQLLKVYVHYSIVPIHLSSSVYPFGGIGVLREWHGIDFAITHVINRGAAWGILASFQDYLLYARILIIGGLLSYILFVTTSRLRKFCFVLIATGAIGNVLDTFIYGHVIDMFYFILWGYSNAVFNLADAAIFCGVAVLLLEALFKKISVKSVKKDARGSV